MRLRLELPRLAWVPLLVLAACWTQPTSAAAQPTGTPGTARASVLFLTVDSFRPDHLSVYGYGRPTTPALASLARDAVVFRNAFAAASWTTPALGSMFTGQFPSVHGVTAKDLSARASLLTPLEALRQVGYRVPDLLHFQTIPDYQNLGFEPMTGESTDLSGVLRWIEQTPATVPFFVAFHSRKVHLPYKPEPPYDRYFRDALAAAGNPPLSPGVDAVRTHTRVFHGSVEFRESDRPLIVALYDGGVQAQDAEIGQALERLKAMGRYDELFIVVSADHGEELLDHGNVGHPSTSLAGTLYDEVLHIPLIVKFPRQRFAGRVIETPVRSVDVLPTLLDGLGVAWQERAAGRSLLPLIAAGGGPTPGPILAEARVCGYACPEGPGFAYLRAVRTDRYKLIERVEAGRRSVTLFDLTRDPAERDDVSATAPDVVAQLQSLLPALTSDE